MKEKLFYFPFYPADWLADTSVLTLEEKGAYITLIATMYLQEDCSLFKRHIPNILGITDKKKFKRLFDNIMPMLIDDGDKISQKRIREVKKRVQEIVVKKSEAGKAGARGRWGEKKPKVYTNKNIDKFSSISRARQILNEN
tara:strand:+ start:13089 stop:13511 length:423 start_codon:yes stop_codon:yes gene_type:complete